MPLERDIGRIEGSIKEIKHRGEILSLVMSNRDEILRKYRSLQERYDQLSKKKRGAK